MKTYRLPALLLAINVHALGAMPFFNVLDYGAHTNSSVSSTEGIHTAIEAAKSAVGGKIL